MKKEKLIKKKKNTFPFKDDIKFTKVQDWIICTLYGTTEAKRNKR